MNRREWISGGLIALAALVPDRLTKAWIRAGRQFPDWPGVLRFRGVTNTGAAFSMLSGRTLALSIATLLLIACVVAFIAVRGERLPRACRAGLWMVVGGGLSNCYDRIRFGGVTDFIEPVFVRFAVFNIADVFIVCGALLAALALIIEERGKDGGA